MSRFTKYAWFVTGYNILVILWGAVVRATGSGAGCGNNWPDCNGAFIPQSESIETLIEFSHRLTSAFAGVLVVALVIWAFRRRPVNKFVRYMSVAALIFTLIEGGIGAALVRLELVENNASSLRAIMIAIHLANTLILLSTLTLTAWGASLSERKRKQRYVASRRMMVALLVGLLGYIVLSAAGAITALGDTLFLSGALTDANGVSDTTHFLLSLRVWHPIIAIGVSVYLVGLCWHLQRSGHARLETWSSWAIMLIAAQIAIGVLNIALRAPVWMQVVHLFVADVLWMCLILLSAEATLAQRVLASLRLSNSATGGADARPAVATGD